jgi:hypothetical protein
MSTNPTAGSPGAPPSGAGAGQPPGQPSEAELRAAYEAELSRITSTDLMLQAAVSLLNVGSYRLAPPRAPAGSGAAAGREQAGAGAGAGAGEPSAPTASDLEQARDAIDGARALLEVLERSVPSEIAPLRDALSQLQMAYARAVQAAGDASGRAGEPGQGGGAPPGGSTPSSGGDSGGAPGAGESQGEQRPPGPGPAESSGRLWVPGR